MISNYTSWQTLQSIAKAFGRYNTSPGRATLENLESLHLGPARFSNFELQSLERFEILRQWRRATTRFTKFSDSSLLRYYVRRLAMCNKLLLSKQ
jgi:hypothetical protein